MNDESVQTSHKNPYTAANIAFPVKSVGKPKAIYTICCKESTHLRIILRLARADIFIQQGVLVLDGSSVVFLI